MKRVVAAIALALIMVTANGVPMVQNPSFEADRFTHGPGYAGGNGKTVTGWTWKGSVGINPYWSTGGRPMSPFADNGRTPDGEHVALCQQNGRLAQEISGFEAGKRYVVTYFENARHNDHPKRNPTIEVRLGGETIVSKHRVPPADDLRSHALSYARVTSAVFEPSEDGAYVLEFLFEGDQAAALIDLVRIEEVESDDEQ